MFLWRNEMMSCSAIKYKFISAVLIFISRVSWLLTGYNKYAVCLVSQSCLTLHDPMDSSPTGSSVHGDSSGKNNGVGCYVLLQGIFPTQGLKPGLLHFRQILYYLSHQRNPYITCMHIWMEYNSAIKKNEILPFAAMLVDLENIMHSKISQTEKYKYYMISYVGP